MDTWNTTLRTSRTRLKRALSVLETLCREDNIPLMDVFRKKGKISFAELYFKTGEPPEQLEIRLESLCDTGCLIQESTDLGNSYRLNSDRILQLNRISRRINQLREDAFLE